MFKLIYISCRAEHLEIIVSRKYWRISRYILGFLFIFLEKPSGVFFFSTLKKYYKLTLFSVPVIYM